MWCIGFLLLVFFNWTVGDHFMGGTISYRVLMEQSTPDDIAVLFTFKFASKRSSEDFCDETTIESGQLIGESNDEDDFWLCFFCPPSVSNNISHKDIGPDAIPLSQTLYQCSSFSVQDDWSAGENTFMARFPSVDTYEILHEECCYIRGLSVSGNCTMQDDDCWWCGGPICGSGLDVQDLYYTFFLGMDLTLPNQFGTINSSPITASVPLLRLRAGCSYAIPIHIDDPDGNPTACRRAREEDYECGAVCETGLNINIDITPGTPCVLHMTPLHMHPGLHPVTLTIGDFNGTQREMFILKDTAIVSTIIPLKFIVDVVHGFGLRCGAHVAFRKDTLKGGTCNPIPVNSTFTTTIYIKEDPCSRLVDVVIVGPIGIKKSNITGYGTYKKVTVTWTPIMPKQEGMHIFCFQALDDFGMYTEQRCVTLLVGATAPKAVPHTASFNDSGEIPFNETQFTITFDQEIRRPEITHHIKILKIGTDHDQDLNNTLVSIDTSISNLINITFNNLTIYLPNSVSLERHGTYLIIMDKGSVVGLPYCIGGGPPFVGLDNWIFTAVPLNICGDGYVDLVDICDDGNNIDDDGCSSNCTIEFAYRCNETTSRTSICIRNKCGDGVVFEPEEECDDFNLNIGDGCDDSCIVEPGYRCETQNTSTSSCINLCSNGIVDSIVEECDNGINVIRDGCSDTNCRILPLWNCTSIFGNQSECTHVTIDFDSSNPSTLGLTLNFTKQGEPVFIANPNLIDTSNYNTTNWKTIVFNLTGVRSTFTENVAYRPSVALFADRLTTDQVLAMRIQETPGNRANKINFATHTLTRLENEAVNLTHVILSVVYEANNPDFFPRQISVKVYDNFNIAGLEAIIALQYLGENSNPPSLQALGGDALFVEKSLNPVELGQVNVSDPDHEIYEMQSATIVILASDISQNEMINLTLTSIAITVQYNSMTGTLYLNGSAPPAEYERLLSSATYFIWGEVGRLQPRSIIYTINDGLHSANSSRELILIIINDPPTLTITIDSITYREGDEPTLLPLVTAFEPDSGIIERAAIRMGRVDLDDVLLIYTTMSQQHPHVTIDMQTIDDILIMDLIGNATEDVYSHLLSAVRFHNSNFNPGNPALFERIVNMSIFDGKFWSNTIQFYVDFIPVNDRPSMQLSGTVNVTQYSSSRDRQANNTYTEDHPAVALIDNITIYDNDSNNGSRLTVVLYRALDGRAENLTFNETLANRLGLVLQAQSWPDTTTFELIVAGNAPFSVYREVLRTFKYANTKTENPITGERLVTFIVADDKGAVSDQIIIRVTILERNDEPDVDLGGGAGVLDSVTYIDGDPVGVELLSHPHRLSIMLPDSAAISKISVELRATHGFTFDATEYIYPIRSFPDTVQLQFGAGAKSVTLSGNAALEDYILAVQALRYVNLENEPTIFITVNGSTVDINRTIIITVTDSGLRGLPPASTVAQVHLDINLVNDNPPIMSLSILPDCTADFEPTLRLHKRSVIYKETSRFDNYLQNAPNVSRIELLGYNGTCIHAGSQLLIQFSSNTNVPPVAKREYLDGILTLSPRNLASTRKLAIWKNAATLMVIFLDSVNILECDRLQVDFHDSSQERIDEKCKHHVCLPNGLSRIVSGSYTAEPVLQRLQL